MNRESLLFVICFRGIGADANSHSLKPPYRKPPLQNSAFKERPFEKRVLKNKTIETGYARNGSLGMG